jgi:hypothetical protein
LLACYEDILKQKERLFSRQFSLLDVFQSSSGPVQLPPVLLDIGGNPDVPPSTPEELFLS